MSHAVYNLSENDTLASLRLEDGISMLTTLMFVTDPAKEEIGVEIADDAEEVLVKIAKATKEVKIAEDSLRSSLNNFRTFDNTNGAINLRRFSRAVIECSHGAFVIKTKTTLEANKHQTYRAP